MTPVEILRAARAKIDRPEKWCQHQYKDEQGRLCVNEALVAARKGACSWGAEKALQEQAGCPSLVFNDLPTTTHADVMAIFDRAIAKLEAERV